MTSLLEPNKAQPTDNRFLPKKLHLKPGLQNTLFTCGDLIMSGKNHQHWIFKLLYARHHNLLLIRNHFEIYKPWVTMIHYLKNKVGVVDFANAQGLVMF